jgi:hypothetical protein
MVGLWIYVLEEVGSRFPKRDELNRREAGVVHSSRSGAEMMTWR